MIVIRGRNGPGFRFTYPWFRKKGGAVAAFQILEARSLLLYTVLNAFITLIVAISRLRERGGHFPESDGAIYLIAFTILLVELAWKISRVWHSVNIDAATLEPLPYSSHLYREHVFFWLAMNQSLFAMGEHYQSTYSVIWNGVGLACLLFMLLPVFNRLLLRFYPHK